MLSFLIKHSHSISTHTALFWHIHVRATWPGNVVRLVTLLPAVSCCLEINITSYTAKYQFLWSPFANITLIMVRVAEVNFMTSPVKKYISYNTSMLKSFRSLILHSHITNSKVSSSKKEKAKAKKPKTSIAAQIMEMDALKNFGHHIKCATPSGGIFTKRYPIHLPGSSIPPAGTGSIPPSVQPGPLNVSPNPLPFPDMDIYSLDSTISMDCSPSKGKWCMQLTSQCEKCSAWDHWWNDILLLVLEIYLEVEANRAARWPPLLPPISGVEDNHLVGNSQMTCAKCQMLIEVHSIVAIQLSSMCWSLFLFHYCSWLALGADAEWWSISYCKCLHGSLSLNIISLRFFPGSPVLPHVAFHFDLLVLYDTLNTAMSTAIKLFRNAFFQSLKENRYDFPSQVCFIAVKVLAWNVDGIADCLYPSFEWSNHLVQGSLIHHCDSSWERTSQTTGSWYWTWVQASGHKLCMIGPQRCTWKCCWWWGPIHAYLQWPGGGEWCRCGNDLVREKCHLQHNLNLI